MLSTIDFNNLSAAEENYIKAIYLILEQNGTGMATNNEVATEVNAKGGSVTEMLQKLDEKKILYYTKYKGVQLSVGGIELARKLLRKHKIWKTFLVQHLLFTEKVATEIAKKLEHLQPDTICERLEDYLQKSNNTFSTAQSQATVSTSSATNNNNIVRLSEMQTNEQGIVLAYTTLKEDFLAYLLQINIKLGSRIKFNKSIEIAKSVEIEIDENPPFHIYQEIAAEILIKI